MKKIRDLVAAGKTAEALAELPRAQSYLDKAAKVNAIHPNAVARHKTQLVTALKAAGSKDRTPKRVIPKAAAKGKTVAKAAAKKPAGKAAPKK